MRKKRGRAPEVLHKAYGGRVLTLADTILSLLPSPPHSEENCPCNGRRCLGCSGTSARTFLLRDGDPSDYLRLLTHAYAVLSDEAPTIAAFYHHHRLQQRNIVKNTIEMIRINSQESPNVICGDYDERTRSSPIVNVLSTSAWSYLLARTGDDLMVHLLRYASIFLPLPTKNHLQIAGPPIDELLQCSNTLKYKAFLLQLGSKSCNSAPLEHHFQSGKQKKMKVDNEKKSKPDETIPMKQHKNSLGIDKSVGTVTFAISGKPRKRVRPFSWQRRRNRRRMIATDVNLNSNEEVQQYYNSNLNHVQKSTGLITCHAMSQTYIPVESNVSSTPEISSTRNEVFVAHISPSECAGGMNLQEVTFPSSGRNFNCDGNVIISEISNFKQVASSDNFILQPPSLLSSEGTSQDQSEISCNNEACADSQADLLQKMFPSQELALQHPTKANAKEVTLHCFHCLMLKAPPKLPIKRKSLFYNYGVSRTVFPSNHILNRLKPNDAGAKFLFKHIFSLPDEHGTTTNSLAYFNRNEFCATESDCIYRSLWVPLKTLIRKAHRCQHLKLLRKHCSVPTLRPCTGKYNGSISKDLNQKKITLFRVLTLRKKYAGLQSTNNLCTSISYDNINKQEEGVPTTKPKVNVNQFELGGSYCRHKQVVSFVWAVCRSIIPVDLLGAPSNWRALRRNISKLVQLRRFENFCLKQCIHGLKMSCFPLLVEMAKSSYCLCNDAEKDANMLENYKKMGGAKTTLTRRFFENWIHWFFSCLVVPLLRANFYITENEAGRQDVFYYRMPIWKKVMNSAIGCLEGKNYRLLDHQSFENILRKRSFGFSKVRFLVKENGVRSLANLKAPSKAWFSVQKSCSDVTKLKSESSSRRWKPFHFKSVNSVLRDLHAVLKGIKAEHPEKLGSSVFDYNDIYRKLCPFIFSLKKGTATPPRMFIIIGDVSKAFDSVNQDKLLYVMKDVICNNRYVLKRYAQVVCAKQSLRVHYGPVSVDQSSMTDITKQAACSPFRSTCSVLVDQVQRKLIKQEALCQCLGEHVKHNILKLGQDFYLQEVGIPQGSALSPLLCSFYYGHLERNVIFPFLDTTYEHSSVGYDRRCRLHVSGLEPAEHELTSPEGPQNVNLEKEAGSCLKGKHGINNNNAAEYNGSLSMPKYLLLRLIDDFLFVSTSKRHAMSFLSRLERGFSVYNCSMNNDKFCTNFDVESQSWLSHKRLYIGEDGASFLPWSGLLINCQTLEIQADYTRYWGIHMISTVTVDSQEKPGFHLKTKLCNYMRPKCHPIFYDSNINSPAIVRLNAYQACLLCSMKFHCYVCALTNGGALSPNYYLVIIQRSLRYMYRCLKKRTHRIELGSNLRPVLLLEKEELEWLGLSAYIRVLRRKQSRHRELLSLLRSKVQTYGRMESMSADLKYAVDDSHSSLFWKIKY